MSDAHFRAGRRQYQAERYEDAEASLREAVSLDPWNLEAQRLLDRVRTYTSDPVDYELIFSDHLDDHPDANHQHRVEVRGLFLEAEQAFGMERTQDARALYLRVLQYLAEHPNVEGANALRARAQVRLDALEP